MSGIININGIECFEENGVAYLKLDTVARGLGFTETAASGNECVKWSRVKKYLADLGFIDTSVDGAVLPEFIPENIFYRLAMKAKNEAAEAFQAKIADEVIPSIRRFGFYPAGQSELTKDVVEARLKEARAHTANILTDLARKYQGTTYEQILNAYATRELTGEFLIALPQMREKTYSAGEIGHMLGISGNKVGHLANRHGLKTDKYGAWFNDKARGHSKELQRFRYFENILPVLRELISEN